MPTPLIVPSDLSGGGTALPRYRALLADELGFYLETTVTAAAASGEARRVVLADEFRDDEAGSEIVAGGSAYLYVRTGELAGGQGRILDQADAGYQGSRSAVVLARPLGTPLSVGAVVAVTSPLPVKRYVTTKGLDDCVNEALARCPAVAVLSLEGDGSNQLSLADYPFITHEDQILGKADRTNIAAADAAAPNGLPFRLVSNGATRHLVGDRSFTSGSTIEATVSLPADRLVYDGATWGYVAENPGLHDENDRASAPEHWVLAFGMVAALRFLQRLTLRRRDIEPDERAALVAEITSRLGQWALAANRIVLTEFPRLMAPKRRTTGLFGGRVTDSAITDTMGAGWP